MTYHGRSLDDLPLAAYSTGVDPDLIEEPEPPEDQHLSQQDAVALALGLDAAPPAPVEEPKAAKRRPGLPRPRLPKLPKPARKAANAEAAAAENALDDSPSWPVAAHVPAPSPSFASGYAPTAAPITAAPMSAAPVAAAPMPAPYAPMPAAPVPASYSPMPAAPAPRPARAAAPAMRPQVAAPAFVKAGPAGAMAVAAPGVRARPWAALDLSGLLGKVRNPRSAVRNPKFLAGAVVLVGGALLVWNLAGGGPGGGGPAAGASPTPGAAVATAPGAASVTLSGSISGTYQLAGATGFGRPGDAHLDSSWTDGLGTSLSLVGRAGAGTRQTGEDLVLTWTVFVDATAVTFTSRAGECTVGMATKPSNVTGSFVCPKLTSADGKMLVKLNGTYQT